MSGVRAYYAKISKASHLPLMPYNIQGWPAGFFLELAKVETIIGVKDNCRVPHEFFRAIKLLGDRFVWVGNKKHDPGLAHLRYQMGMEAFTSGQSNYWPDPELEIHAAALRKDWNTIVNIQDRIAPFKRLRLAHDAAAVVKGGMDILGLRGGRVSAPRCDAPPEARKALRRTLEELGIVTGRAP